MGLILDTSILIADEKGKFDLADFVEQFSTDRPVISTITVSELLHGIERANDEGRRLRRSRHVEQILETVRIEGFGLRHARVHARIWASLASRGKIIGPHDLIIAATGISLGYPVATLNAGEFQRVDGLKVIDARAHLRK